MSATNSTQWFWSDWAGDQEVRRLTPAERGVWIDLLALAAVGNPTGYVCDKRGNPLSYEEIARFTNASPTEVESLIAAIVEKGAASRDRSGRLFNRRMVRAKALSEKRKEVGKAGGEATKLKWKAVQDLAQQNARQLLGDTGRVPSNSKITSTEFGAAREGPAEGSNRDAKRFTASDELLARLTRKTH